MLAKIDDWLSAVADLDPIGPNRSAAIAASIADAAREACQDRVPPVGARPLVDTAMVTRRS
jgi:hypothetical protein